MAIPSGVYLVLALFHALLAGLLLLSPSAHSAKVNISISPTPWPLNSPSPREVYTITWVHPLPASPRHHSITDPRTPPFLSQSCLLALPQSWSDLLSSFQAGKQWLSFPFPLLAYVLILMHFFFFRFQKQNTNL